MSKESPVGNDWYEDPQSGRLHPKLMVSDAFPKILQILCTANVKIVNCAVFL